jgi:hypothetical protein
LKGTPKKTASKLTSKKTIKLSARKKGSTKSPVAKHETP